MRSLLRQPLVHFLLLGALLLAGREALLLDGRSSASRRIALEPDRLEELREGFRAQTGRTPRRSRTCG